MPDEDEDGDRGRVPACDGFVAAAVEVEVCRVLAAVDLS